jgi:hypothetical protein
MVPWMTSSTIAESYPENTVKGMICLGLRLDLDKDNSKETSDVYLKPWLIVIASVLCSLFLTQYLFIFKAKHFMQGFCVAQDSFAAIGGKQRKNLLTFQELKNCHLLILFFLLLESLAIFIFYRTQDSLGQTIVFMLYMISSGISDFFMIILLPASILYKSLEKS